ncbi:MAG: hypothetical protein L6R39_000491 [Caloplaca ligustica]|nr:MAG: hypothetical protein L6R39_000491 [Caloplaca ligustica]
MSPRAGNEPIAVVGSACRFPGKATSPSKLWELLKAPNDLSREIPQERFNVDRFYHPDNMHHGTSNVRHSYVLEEDFKAFDANFFGVKPVEALAMDPQQRLLLETVYEGLEAAGLPVEKLQGSQTGVFVGNMGADYADIVSQDLDTLPTYFASGTARSILSNRISYFFDWHGPSVMIDTACSSSLVAVHQAVQSLRSGESSLAVAAGANLLLGSAQYVAESKLKMLSPNGKSRMWDEAADGYARGEGFAAVILKTVRAAMANGDHIECLIRETGTPAGDPVEAEAIATAFYGSDLDLHQAGEEQKLLVGSIKTVIGHTEGTAGLASLLKASLALQRKEICPNLHLERLNPAVKPFYTNLEIPTTLQPWPQSDADGIRRNAHAILEAYEDQHSPRGSPTAIFSPFLFSASSDRTLSAMLEAHAKYLQAHPDVDLRDLAYTLHTRRSLLPRRAVISARSVESLCDRLLVEAQSGTRRDVAAPPLSTKPRILGIFTGQGAQWARMGAEIVESSPSAFKILEELQESLATLPPSDRPSWSIIDELLKGKGSSRLDEAEISQPLCTALQVMLVIILREAGITFDAVVGHSSGEIAAAYAAGVISASDAIRIAYYRGFHLHLGQGSEGKQGAMMAVGTTFDDAEELCRVDDYRGRLCVAASNSSTSITLSGDADAIEEAQDVLASEDKFVRRLKVDKAYHSHHMVPCSKPYVQSLQMCGINSTIPEGTGCQWISSVYADDIVEVNDRLQDTYWANNMVRPVLFSQAVTYALSEHGPFHQVLEVGPHPALKGPVMQTVEAITGDPLPYAACLSRGKDGVEALAEGLGSIWADQVANILQLNQYESYLSGAPRHQLLKDLPSYSWDHQRAFYHESRISKARRTQPQSSHELLGTQQADTCDREIRWRNLLNPREVPWLKDHQVQGQPVFPGAGYISTALEAIRESLRDSNISTIEIRDLVIAQALMIEEDYPVEVLVSLTNIQRTDTIFHAHFAFFSQEAPNSVSMVENASCDILVRFGDFDAEALPPRPVSDCQMFDLEANRFYNAVGRLGYSYTGPFRALSGLTRKLDVAAGFIAVPETTPVFGKLLVHPAQLDAAIQSMILAYCYPGDTSLRTIQLPTGVDCIRFNVPLCASTASGSKVPFRSSVAPGNNDEDINGDVDVFAADGRTTIIQLQGLHTKPLTAADDLNIFSEFSWEAEHPSGGNLVLRGDELEFEKELFSTVERVAYFYLRNLDRSFPKNARQGLVEHQTHLFQYLDHTLQKVEHGNHAHVRKEYSQDTREDVLRLIAQHPTSIDIQLMHAVGENWPAIMRGEMNMLEPMVENNMLNRFYTDALGMERYLQDLTRIAKQISHRYPHMSVLEVGAGTGGATKVILRELDDAFGSYCYTDISSGFFNVAQETFRAHEAKMKFKTLDIEKDIGEQGFEEQSYDLLIANLVVHATKKLEDTMRNLRRLLKPGGYLLLLEITDNEPLRFGFIFGGLPGWWLGHEERPLSPCVDVPTWNEVMRKTGFSGVDALTGHVKTCPLSVLLTQAVDDRVRFMREPLSATRLPEISKTHLTIVGGAEANVLHLSESLRALLAPAYSSVTVLSSVEHILVHDMAVMGSVMVLSDLEQPIFDGITRLRFQALQQIFRRSRNVSWVTWGCRGGNPGANMVVGAGRNIVLEMEHVRLQFVDFDAPRAVNAETLASKHLQFEAADVWERRNTSQGLLWSCEPEICYANGHFMLPRIRLSKERNMRYNSLRRSLVKRVDVQETPLTLLPSGQSYSIFEDHLQAMARTRLDPVTVHVSHSVLRSVKVASQDYLFIVMGSDDRGKPVFALSDKQSPVIHIDRSWTFPRPYGTIESRQMLVALYEQLLVRTLLSGLHSDDNLVILDVTESMRTALMRRCGEKGVSLCTLSSAVSSRAKNITLVYEHESKRSIQSKLPSTVSCFATMSTTDKIAEVVVACLPAHCNTFNLGSLTDDRSYVKDSSFVALDSEVANLLRTAATHVYVERYGIELDKVPIATPTEISAQATLGKGISLVDWASDTDLHVQIQPAPGLVRFPGDKTYWLVGLTGGLGLAICRWMVDRGAKHIVMTSRKPKVDSSWLEEMEALGATVKIFPNDVTDRNAVRAAYTAIRSTMPPIAGVAQGAMVLQDALFADMELDAVERVMKPKVNGSIYLDELFHDSPLDFFIFFSSVAAISGNKGQSMYGAANTFMHALAAQRRQRGVAGSVIDIGCVMGNGYVTRELTEQQQQYLEDVGNVWLSEHDFLTIFAEAILASPPGAPGTMAFLTGLKMQSGESEKVSWSKNPIFQHLVQKTTQVAAAGASSPEGLPLRQQLEGAKAGEIQMIIANAFAVKLRSALQADADREILNTALDELGMDSLVAIEVRSWFLKELSADIPIFKILKATTPNALLASAWDLLPNDLVASPLSDEQPQVENHAQVEEHEKPAVEAGTSVNVHDGEARGDGLASIPPLEGDSKSSASSPILSDDALDSGSMSSVSEALSQVVNSCERTVPMSFGQSRFWFLSKYIEDQTAFNITVCITLKGDLDVERFKQAFHTVTEMHESLRTSYDSAANQPMQTVWKHSNNRILARPVLDENQVEEACNATHKHVYNLKDAETMRIELLSLSPATHFLILGYHHINMDGIALEILVAEIEKAYVGTSLTSDMIQYADFSMRERQEYESGSWSSELDFWHSEFPRPLTPLPLLPLAKRSSRPAAPNYGTVKAERNIDVDLSAKIQQTCRKFRATPYHFHLAILSTLLARHTETNDLCIGLGDANRKDPDVRESLGLYLNLVPLRVNCDTDKVFSQTLKEVQQKSQQVFAHSRVPFDILLSELNVPRSSAYTPLFQAFMNYRQGIRQMRSFCGCDCEGKLVGGGQVAYDISVDITENPGGEALVSLSLQQDLYDQVHAETLLGSYFNLLDAFAANPASRLRRPALHSQVDVDQALQLGPGLSYQYTWPSTIVHRIDEMVKAYPSRVALTDSQGLCWTYTDMAQRIDGLCATLQAKRITGIVAVFQSPTPAFVCSILAILRIGLTYVPLDPRAGIPRLASIVSECSPVCIIVDPSTRGELVALGFDGIVVDVSAVSPTSSKAIPIIAQSDAMAAVIYTSGSTGTPKGICLSHSSLRNNLEVATQRFDYREGREVTLGQCAFSFDMSLAQTFTTLCNGGTLVVVPKKLRGDSLAVASLIATEKVTWTQATPSEYISWIQHGHEALKSSCWRFACAGGEQVTPTLIECFRSLEKEDLVLCDAYGPAEITFSCNSSVIPYNGKQSRHEGLATWPNYAIYILDHAFKPLPVNVPGEVFIAGAGLGPGYLRKPTLTNERFLNNPYASPWFISQGWLSMHRTGDQGRLTSEGKLVLEGRIEGDTQIKLRGIRIDFRDVEAAIIQTAAGQVTDAAVSARETSGNVFLVAHLVLNHPEDAVNLQELQARLPLPQYMKPSSMIPIARLPTNDSNKLDRKALATLVTTEPSRTSVSEGLTIAQAEMKALWAQVIPEELMRNFDVGPHSDFFHVGGTSLLLVNLQGLLKQRTTDAPALHRLFEASTLERMASFLEDATVRKPLQHINWEQEADLLPRDLYTQTEPNTTRASEQGREPPSRIILTGATGFLGKKLLARLLQLPTVRIVYCIAVRQDLGSLPSIFQDPRVDSRAGDLASPTLGLGSDETDAIFSSADVIIHNGADVSFMKTYPSLKRTNVVPTKYLARLAVSHRIPFHFISSASVAQLTGLDTIGEVSVSQWAPGPEADGYTAAKWVAERHLEKINEQFQLPVVIHRPSSITGEGSGSLDLMSNMFKYVELLEAVPQGPAWKGYFDFISVHSVAAAVVKSVAGPQEAAVRYFYSAGEIVYPLSVVKELTDGGSGLPVATLPVKEWVDAAEAKGLDVMLAAYMRTVGDSSNPMAFPKLLKDQRG